MIHDCTHCGEPLTAPVDGDGPAFCCTGCEAVYEAIHGDGLQAFYALREASCELDPVKPLPGGFGASASVLFDAETFLETHSEALDNGEHRIELVLEGVHCAGCVWIVERLPHVFVGVKEARLDLPRARLMVRWKQSETPLSEVGKWLSRFGYAAHPIRAEGLAGRQSAERRLLVRVGVCWALAGNVMLLAFALYSGLDAAADPVMYRATVWVSLILSLASVWVGGRVFLARAWASLAGLFEGPHRFQLSMDVPIALGIIVGWGHSAWASMAGTGEVWFDSISVLIAALLTARWLQQRGRRAATDAADRLLSLIPSTARRIEEGGAVTSVLAEVLETGDRVEVRAGEVFPADGEVISGTSEVHLGVLTGESVPVRLVPGDAVHAGATNLGSVVQVRVQASGVETRVGRLLAWIGSQGAARAPVVQTADRLGGIFVGVVVLAAALTGLVWWQIDPSRAASHAVALLVISCPCALGMATPLALTVAVGRAARRGIFIKHEDVIERLAGLTHIVLDKTGTLTLGKMSVLEIEGDSEAVRLAALLEAGSGHPIAAALRRWATLEAAAAPEGAQEVPGKGMEGMVEGARVQVGRPDWILGLVDAPELTRALAAQVERGRTPVAVAIDGRPAALIGLGDPLRPEARGIIAEMHARGAQVVLLSGDHPGVVSAAGRQLGLEPSNVHGGVSPEEKQAFIEGLRAVEGRSVMMVGDGVNDAAALQAADIGVAVHGGSEVSLVASDIFISRPGLEPVAGLLSGADEVLRVIRRSLVASLVYNAVGITLAGLGLVGPLLAAIAMPISSLAVVFSSLAQRPFAPRRRPTQVERSTPSVQILREPIA